MTDAVWIFYLSAAITGGAFGYVIQRGGFCLMRALSNLYLMGDATIMRAYTLALLVAMVGVQALSTAGLVDIPVRPFHWMSNVTGGLIFGAGMVLAGGCSGSTRSEEHTSELQSRLHLVCRLLLEKKNNYNTRKRLESLTKGPPASDRSCLGV